MDEKELLETFSPNTSTVIRKLRKKLRQIENLERLERDLTEEEEVKVRFLLFVVFVCGISTGRRLKYKFIYALTLLKP